MQTASAPSGTGAPVVMAITCPFCSTTSATVPAVMVPTRRQARRDSIGVLGAQGVTVHRCIGEARHVLRCDYGLAEDTTERLVERYSVRWERSKGTEKLGPRIFEGDRWSGALVIVHQISAWPLRRARERNARGRTGPPRPRVPERH